MADPTSLKFDIILNDKEFKSQINADIDLAKRLNDEVSKSLNVGHLTKASTQAAVATEKVTTATKEVTKAQKGAQAAIEQSAKSLTSGGGLTRAWLRFSATMWSVISAVRLFTRTLGAAIKNIANFQQANANLATIMQVSRKEIEVLTNDALMLGRTTEWTASQVTELQTALAKLGFNIPQIRNMQASVLQFATAVGAELPAAANLAGASLRMFGMRSSEMQKALEILAASTNKTALDFEKLKVSLPYVGAIAHSIGFDIAQTASLLGVLTNAGLESSRAGTGLRQVLLELSKTNGKLQTAMGGNVKSFDDFVNALRAMRDRGLEAGEATKLVSTRASSALLILANGVDDIARLNEEVRDTDGLLKTIQSERLDTLHGSTLLLKSAWEGLIQTFRDSAGPMKDIVDWLTKIIRATSLAASRANRVAQGTKDVMGSDEITNRFKQRFEQLLEDEKTPEQAAEIVRNEMQKWIQGAYSDLEEQQRKGYKETPFNRFLMRTPLTAWTIQGKMRNGRAANEQVEAVENAYDAVVDYIDNRSKEEGEIAANNFLNKWKATFDAEGEDAARKAMSQVAGYELIKAQVDEYIKNGGAAGAQDRGKGGESAEKKKRKELIDDLKDEARYLDKLKDSFEKLEPFLGEEGAMAKMREIFGIGDYSKESIEQGVLAITEALRGMGDEGKEAAESIENSWGLDKVSLAVKQLQKDKKDAEDAQKALEKYEATLRKWQSEDFNLAGTGFEYDINKVFSDMNTKLGQVEEKYIKAVEQAKEAHAGNAKAIDEEIKKLRELKDAEMAYVRVQSQESLNDLAESYLKDQYFLRGINLDHLGRKSIKQLEALRKELEEVSREALRMGNEFTGLEQTLASWGLDIENITEDDLEALKDRLPEASIEMVRLMKAAKETGLSMDTLQKKIQSAIDKGLKNLAEEEKNAIIKLAKYAAKQILELADAFRELGEATGNSGLTSAANSLSAIADVAKSAMEGFSQGGWIGAVIGGIVSVAKKFVEAETEAAKFKNTVIELQEQLRHTAAMNSLSVGNIFGAADLERIRKAKKLLEETSEKLADMSAVKVYRGRPQPQDGIAGAMSRHGFSPFDENGILNKESLEAMKELYPDDTRWQHAIDLVDEYYAALDDVKDVSEALIGSVVSSLTDQIVDSWWEAGQAALDYNDILADVAKGYAKLIVQEALMKAAFDDEREKAFIDALKDGDTGKAMSIIEGAMQATVDMLPTVNEALQVLEPYRQLASGNGQESNSVGAGIKSITEDTANLLASYINAIRADVSYIRLMQEKGWGVIENLGVSLPNLNDYMAQVAANTFNTAQATQAVLSELQSVIGAPGTSGMVMRVESY